MATEQEIQELLEDIVDSLKRKGTRGFAPQDIQRKIREQAKTSEEFRKLNLALKKRLDKEKILKEEIEAITDEYEKQYDQLRKQYKLQEDIQDSLKTLRNGFFSLGDASQKGGEEIATYTGLFKDIPVFGQGLDALGKSFDFNLGIFRSLAEVGADFGQSLIGLRVAARDARLPLLEFTDFISRNSDNLAALFGSVNQGTAAVAGFATNIRSKVLPELAGLGLTTANYLEYLETFLETQRLAGRREQIDQETVTQGVRAYALQLDRVTKLTGIQREQLDAGVRAQRSDATFYAFLQTQGPERQRELQTFVAGLQSMNPALGDAVKNILATGFPFGEFESNLVATSDNMLPLIMQLRSGQISVEDFAKGLAANADNFIPRFGSAILRTNSSLAEVGNGLLGFQREFASTSEIQKQQREAQEAFTKGLGVTQESLRQFKGSLEGIQTSFLESIGPSIASALGQTSDGLMGLADDIRGFTTMFPRITAAAFTAALAGKYLFDYAEQIGITAVGTAAGMRMVGLGTGGIFAQMATGIGGVATTLASLAVIFVGISRAFSADQRAKAAETRGAAVVGGINDAIISGFATGFGVGMYTKNPVVGLIAGLAAATLSGVKTAIGISQREMGGDVQRNMPYLVGEKGPELIVPKQQGYVLTANQTRSAMQTTTTPAVMSQAPDMGSALGKKMDEFVEVAKKLETHMRASVALSSKTMENTKQTASGLRQLSGNLV